LEEDYSTNNGQHIDNLLTWHDFLGLEVLSDLKFVPKMKRNIIPDQQTGKAVDAKSTIELKGPEEAKAFFSVVKDRLENVNQWKDIAGTLSATFQLVDANGTEVQRKAQKGDYFKIDIPGPGSSSGHGYDWVQIEEVETTTSQDAESFGFRVRPADNPRNQKDDVAHFYSPESTSSFLVMRNGNMITASVHDRNTKPNTTADSTMDKIRDAVVGSAGVLSFSEIQWEKLTDGLLKKD
jgi:hypothetical protein